MATKGTKKQMSQREIDKHIKELFSTFDKDKNGTVSEKELRSGMFCLLGLNPTTKEMDEIFHEMDTKGEITFSQFDKCLQQHFKKAQNITKVEEINILKSAFKKFDKNGDGYFDIDELKTMLNRFGDKVTDKEVEEVFKYADSQKKDGKLHYDEFVKIFVKDM